MTESVYVSFLTCILTINGLTFGLVIRLYGEIRKMNGDLAAVKQKIGGIES